MKTCRCHFYLFSLIVYYLNNFFARRTPLLLAMRYVCSMTQSVQLDLFQDQIKMKNNEEEERIINKQFLSPTHSGLIITDDRNYNRICEAKWIYRLHLHRIEIHSIGSKYLESLPFLIFIHSILYWPAIRQIQIVSPHWCATHENSNI